MPDERATGTDNQGCDALCAPVAARPWPRTPRLTALRRHVCFLFSPVLIARAARIPCTCKHANGLLLLAAPANLGEFRCLVPWGPVSNRVAPCRRRAWPFFRRALVTCRLKCLTWECLAHERQAQPPVMLVLQPAYAYRVLAPDSSLHDRGSSLFCLRVDWAVASRLRCIFGPLVSAKTPAAKPTFTWKDGARTKWVVLDPVSHVPSDPVSGAGHTIARPLHSQAFPN